MKGGGLLLAAFFAAWTVSAAVDVESAVVLSPETRRLLLSGGLVSEEAAETWLAMRRGVPEDGAEAVAASEPSREIFELLAVDYLLRCGDTVDPDLGMEGVLAALDRKILAMPLNDAERFSEQAVEDFYRENQDLFLIGGDRLDILLVDLALRPDAVTVVNDRLRQGEPLRKILPDFKDGAGELKDMLPQPEVQMLLEQVELENGDDGFFRGDRYALWFRRTRGRRRFRELDANLKREIEVLLRVNAMGGWSGVFGLTPGMNVKRPHYRGNGGEK